MPIRNQQKDRALLVFIQDYSIAHGYPPTVREMTKGLGYKSISVLYSRVARLRREGHLTWEDNRVRTIRLAVPEGRP